MSKPVRTSQSAYALLADHDDGSDMHVKEGDDVAHRSGSKSGDGTAPGSAVSSAPASAKKKKPKARKSISGVDSPLAVAIPTQQSGKKAAASAANLETPPPSPTPASVTSSVKKATTQHQKEVIAQAAKLQKAASKAAYASPTPMVPTTPAKTKSSTAAKKRAAATRSTKPNKRGSSAQGSDFSIGSLLQLVFVLLVILLHRCPPNNPTAACRAFREHIPYSREMIWWYQENMYAGVQGNIVAPAEALYTEHVAPVVAPIWAKYGAPVWTQAEPHVLWSWSQVHRMWNVYVAPGIAPIGAFVAEHVSPVLKQASDAVGDRYRANAKPHVDTAFVWVTKHITPVIIEAYSTHLKPNAIHAWNNAIHPALIQARDTIVHVYTIHVHPRLVLLWRDHLEDPALEAKLVVMTYIYGEDTMAPAHRDLLRRRQLKAQQAAGVEDVVVDENAGDVRILPVVDEETKRKEHEEKLRLAEEQKAAAEKVAAEKVAAEEAARVAKVETDRLAAEKAAAEKAAIEEASRKAKLEADRLAADEAARKAEEDRHKSKNDDSVINRQPKKNADDEPITRKASGDSTEPSIEEMLNGLNDQDPDKIAEMLAKAYTPTGEMTEAERAIFEDQMRKVQETINKQKQERDL